MKKNTILIFIVLLSSCSYYKPRKIATGIYDIGTYKSTLDCLSVANRTSKSYINKNRHSIVIAKELDASLYIGKNADALMSNKPTYIVKTAVKGKFKTLGLSYHFGYLENFYNIDAYGANKEDFKYIPSLCSDILNEKGLYVSCLEFSMTDSDYFRALSTALFLAQSCSSFDEVVQYLKDCSQNEDTRTFLYPSFSLMVADSDGNYGIIENKKYSQYVYEKASLVCDEFITPSLNENVIVDENYANRKVYIENNLSNVSSVNDLKELLSDVCYKHNYEQGFDKYPIIETEYNYHEYDTTVLDIFNDTTQKLEHFQALNSHKELWYWTAFSIVANCKEKTLDVCFYEDDKRRFTFSI